MEAMGFAADEFREADHPRGQPENAGQFGSGGGGKPSGRSERAPTKSATTPATDLFNKETDPHATTASIMAALPEKTRQAIKSAETRIARGTPTDAPVSEGGHKRPDGTYTAEREALHQKIIATLLSPEAIEAATPRRGEKPTFTILGGRPFSVIGQFEVGGFCAVLRLGNDSAT